MTSYDLLVTSPDTLPLSYRRLVGAFKITKMPICAYANYDKDVIVNLKPLLLIVKCLLVQDAYYFCSDVAKIFTVKKTTKRHAF